MSKKCLVAVDVRSAHNVGSFFRTCDGLGVDLILVGATPRPKHKGDDRLPHISLKAHNAVAKTALGAEETVSWRYFEKLEDAINELKHNSYKVYALEQNEESVPLKELSVSQNTAIVVGREVEGLSSDEILLCDGVYEIPMIGKKESFNVAVAAGMALYQMSL